MRGTPIKRRWVVSYVAATGRPVKRYFPTRPRAWAFYRSLFRRPLPPWEQSIKQETFPIEFRDLRLVDYRPGLFAKINIRRCQVIVLLFNKPFFYDSFRLALRDRAGFELPAKNPGARAWRAFLNSRKEARR